MQEVYELLSIVQNSPSGMPVFARPVGHGLLNISRISSLDLQLLTIGLPDSGWRAFAAHKDPRNFGIHDQSTIYPEDANCDSVDVDTARLFAESDAVRQVLHSQAAKLLLRVQSGGSRVKTQMHFSHYA